MGSRTGRPRAAGGWPGAGVCGVGTKRFTRPASRPRGPRRPAQQSDPATQRRHAEQLLRDGLVVPLEHHTEAGHDGVERRRRIRDGPRGHRPPSRPPRHAGRPQCADIEALRGSRRYPSRRRDRRRVVPPCSGQWARGFGRAAREGPRRRPSAWSTTNIAPSVGLGWLRKRRTSDVRSGAVEDGKGDGHEGSFPRTPSPLSRQRRGSPTVSGAWPGRSGTPSRTPGR